MNAPEQYPTIGMNLRGEKKHNCDSQNSKSITHFYKTKKNYLGFCIVVIKLY